MPTSEALDELRQAVDASGLSKAEIVRRTGTGTPQWLGRALAGKEGFRLSVQEAEEVAREVGYELHVIKPGDAVNEFRRALRANRLDPRSERIIWRAFLEARAEELTEPAGRGKRAAFRG